MSPLTVETGVVKWFNSQSDKRYGFLLLSDGSELFFHYNDGQLVKPTKEGPVFEPESASYWKDSVISGHPRIKVSTMKMPKPGDVIVFLRTKGSQGRPKASPWAYADKWEEAKLHFYPEYRLMYMTGDFQVPRSAWNGKNLSDQNLEGVWPHGGRPYYSECWFEFRESPDENWKNFGLGDPRDQQTQKIE